MRKSIKMLSNFENCKDCYWNSRCKKYGTDKVCEDFDPLDTDTYCANIESYLKEHVSPTSEKRMSLRASEHKELGVRCETSLNEYYCSMINDTVHELKEGHTAYVFSIEQIADVMRFLSDIHINFNDGVYYLTL
jgi:hypothetical protein